MSREASRFVVLVLAFVLAFIVGWLLVIGQGILLPIFAAVISVYVLSAAADAMGRLPFLGRLPFFLRRLLVLVGFTLSFVALGLVVAVTVNQLIGLIPTYKQNLETIIAQLADLVGFDKHPSWEEIRGATIGRIDFGTVLTSILGSVTNFGTTIFLVVVYAIFLVAERGTFAGKLMAAFPQGDSAERTGQLITDINRRIGEYLAVKTLINVILGVASYVVMLVMGLDFALFWAVLIGLFNYIPYVGSLIAVFLPVGLSLAQFGSISTTLVLAGLLIVPQVYVGNFLEPRMLSKQLNLSPFVVLVALAVWSALWGLPGAILAIPMTSMLAIIFGAFPATRFIAVLLSERVNEPE
ncbi:MAG: AI-2E family transporter [Bauldia sp.]|uniref:AI-2E family transporter n=1 Tax=Bauldia sp. TaxID=2575872 RepID=UPI001D412D1E|nr:AI-2E family transporter [Bauldia sp.]MCB1498134.1 AI-2E family transporter [Bauldia sp.]